MSTGVEYDVDRVMRHFAQLEVDRFTSELGRQQEQFSRDFNWLTASLLLINSGSLVAILNSEMISIVGKKTSGVAFLIGLLMALLVGRLSQHFSGKTMAPIIGLRAYWVSVSQGRQYESADEQEYVQKVIDAGKHAWAVQIPGWLSVVAFVAGCAIASTYLISKSHI